MTKPSAEDMARDIAADLASLTLADRSRRLCVCLAAREGWPAAIRRARWAEAELARVTALAEERLDCLRAVVLWFDIAERTEEIGQDFREEIETAKDLIEAAESETKGD